MIRPLKIENWLKEKDIVWAKSRSKNEYIKPAYDDEEDDEENQEEIDEEEEKNDNPACVGRITYKFPSYKSVIIKVEYLKNKKRLYTFSQFYKDIKGNRCETGFSASSEDEFIAECERRQIAEYVFGE